MLNDRWKIVESNKNQCFFSVCSLCRLATLWMRYAFHLIARLSKIYAWFIYGFGDNLHSGEHNSPIRWASAALSLRNETFFENFVSYVSASHPSICFTLFTVGFACHKTMNKRIRNDSQSLNYFMIVAPQQKDFFNQTSFFSIVHVPHDAILHINNLAIIFATELSCLSAKFFAHVRTTRKTNLSVD